MLSTTNPSTSTANGWLGLYNAKNLSTLSVLSIGNSGSDEAVLGLSVDGTGTIPGDGSVYGTGYFKSNGLVLLGTSLSNADQSLSYTPDIFVFKINRDVTLGWVVKFGAVGNDGGHAIATSTAGDAVYVTGYYISTMTMGSTTLTGAGNSDTFVAKLSTATGAVLWATRLYGTNNEQGKAIAVDRSTAYSSSESVIVVGYTNSGPFTAGSFSLTAGGMDGYVVRLNGATGAVLNATLVGGTLEDSLHSVSVHDTTGNIYASGYTYSTSIAFGATTYTRTGNTIPDPLVVKLGPDFSKQWLYTYSATTTAGEWSRACSLDQATETLYVAMTLAGTHTFGSTTTTSRSVIVSFSSTGTIGRVVEFKDTPTTSTANDPFALVVDDKNNVWLGGAALTSNNVNIAGIRYVNWGGTSDSFVALYDTTLTALWEPIV